MEVNLKIQFCIYAKTRVSVEGRLIALHLYLSTNSRSIVKPNSLLCRSLGRSTVSNYVALCVWPIDWAIDRKQKTWSSVSRPGGRSRTVSGLLNLNLLEIHLEGRWIGVLLIKCNLKLLMMDYANGHSKQELKPNSLWMALELLFDSSR